MRSRPRCLYRTDQFCPFTDISGQKVASCRVSASGCGFEPALRFRAHENLCRPSWPQGTSLAGYQISFGPGKIVKGRAPGSSRGKRPTNSSRFRSRLHRIDCLLALFLKRLHFCQVDAAFAAMKATCVRSTISFRANYTTAQKNSRKNKFV